MLYVIRIDGAYKHDLTGVFCLVLHKRTISWPSFA